MIIICDKTICYFHGKIWFYFSNKEEFRVYLNFNHKIVILSILVFISSNCAPVTSDMQSAKLLGRGGLDITFNRGNLDYKGTFESEIDSEENEEFNSVQENYGVLVGFGLTDKIDLRARIENIDINNNIAEGRDFRLISFGTKYSILKDRLSLYVPFSTYNTGDENEGTHLDRDGTGVDSTNRGSEAVDRGGRGGNRDHRGRGGHRGRGAHRRRE